MKKEFAICILAYFTLFAGHIYGATVKFVTPSGNGSQDGISWNNALPGDSLQYAINTSIGGQVWVAAGIYYPTKDTTANHTPVNPRDKTFTLRSNVAVYGGFAGNETSIDQRTRSDRDNDSKISAWEFASKFCG